MSEAPPVSTQDSARVEIRSFAERILFGATLEDKLFAPHLLSDHRPGSAISTPSGPARSSSLKLTPQATRKKLKGAKESVRASVDGLRDPLDRAHLLHTFAHHELLSLELMALALLKYPEAPSAFRRGLVQVIKDEQRHFEAYRVRFEALGLTLGEASVSDFFWRCVADAPSPHEFNLRLSLVFEQANIDFTRYYAPLMTEVGDIETAETLEMIYRDEVRHVKHGLHWFRRWSPSNEPEWDHFCRLLRPPLSPGRAKGAIFSVEGRRAIGFDEDYIDQLRRWGGSTGRPPQVWWPNFHVEDEIGGRLEKPKVLKQAQETRSDLAPTLGWLSARGDIICASTPSAQFQDQMLRTLGHNPEWVEALDSIQGRTLGGLSPWGWSEHAVTALRPLADSLRGTSYPPNLAPTHLHAHSKLWSVSLRDQLWAHLERLDPLNESNGWLQPHEAICCLGWDEAQAAIERLHRRHEWLIVKASYGAAGRHLLKLRRDHLSASQLGWVRRVSRQDGVVIEPYWDRVADLSYHGRVISNSVKYDGIVLSDVDHRGAYRGSWISRPSQRLSVDIKRALNADGRDPKRAQRVARAAVQAAGHALIELGYEGPFGVDALIAQSERGLHLHPLIEVNPRWTMGRIALRLRALLISDRPVHMALIRKPKDEDDAWAERYIEADPPRWDDRDRWIGGLLPLNDAWHHPQLLCVAQHREELGIR